MANLLLVIPFIKKVEGGLSRATTDTASKNPAPFSYNGKNGYHTNKGVTWTTFFTAAKTLGYVASSLNFFTMPDAIWLKIYEKLYWKPMQADKLKSEAVAAFFADFAWISGVGGATSNLKKFLLAEYNYKARTMLEVVDFINTKNEVDLIKKLVAYRKNHFKKLNQPANLKGWLNRLAQLEAFALTLKKKIKPKQNLSAYYDFFNRTLHYDTKFY